MTTFALPQAVYHHVLKAFLSLSKRLLSFIVSLLNLGFNKFFLKFSYFYKFLRYIPIFSSIIYILTTPLSYFHFFPFLRYNLLNDKVEHTSYKTLMPRKRGTTMNESWLLHATHSRNHLLYSYSGLSPYILIQFSQPNVYISLQASLHEI